MSDTGDDPQADFIREAVLLSRRWRARIDEELKPTGLTLARFTVLYWLAEARETMTQSQLADVVGIEGPTLVRQLHALEAAGLIERASVPGDRRAKAIRLTPAATPMIAQLQAVTDTLCIEHFGRLDKRRMASATKLMREARASLE